MKKYGLKFTQIDKFDETKPHMSAEITQDICDILNSRIPREKIKEGKSTFGLFAQFPQSSHSKHKSLAKENIRKALNLVADRKFKERAKGRELKVELIFFIAEDYERKDVDNFIKPVIDALEGFWFDNDAQVKEILAEKYKVKDIEKSKDPRIYEQIACIVTILD